MKISDRCIGCGRCVEVRINDVISMTFNDSSDIDASIEEFNALAIVELSRIN